MKLKKLALSALLHLVVAFPFMAHATSVTFTIGGKVAGLDSQLLSGPIQAGDPFSWTIIYDDQTPFLTQTSISTLYLFQSPLQTSHLNVGNGAYSVSSALDLLNIITTNTNHLISINSTGGGTSINGYDHVQTQFSFNNQQVGTPLAGIDLTSLNSVNISAFPLSSAYSLFTFNGSGTPPGGDTSAFVIYNITNFSFAPSASPVPEPSTALLLATGVMGLGVSRFISARMKGHTA